MQPGDKGGGGAAAAAHHRNTDGGVGAHFGGKAIRVKIIAAVRVGQACIGLDKDRHARRHTAAEPLCKGQNLLGAEGAVDTHGVRAEADRGHGIAFNGATGEGAAAAFKAHRGENRKGAVLLGGQNGGLQLIQIGHCFEKDKVGPGRCTGADDLCKFRVGILKAQCAGGNQQLTQRADVQRNKRTGAVGSPAGAGDGGSDNLLYSMAAAHQFFGVGAKGVGKKNIRTRVDIVSVDGGQCFGHFQRGKLRLLPGLQAACLQLGAHAAVQKNKPLAVKNFTNLHKILPYQSC